MAYAGPERRQADRLHKLSDEYRLAYAFTRRMSVNWSPESLRVRLRVLMSALPYYEESWGEVDALADLLGEHQPPWGRAEV